MCWRTADRRCLFSGAVVGFAFAFSLLAEADVLGSSAIVLQAVQLKDCCQTLTQHLALQGLPVRGVLAARGSKSPAIQRAQEVSRARPSVKQPAELAPPPAAAAAAAAAATSQQRAAGPAAAAAPAFVAVKQHQAKQAKRPAPASAKQAGPPAKRPKALSAKPAARPVAAAAARPPQPPAGSMPAIASIAPAGALACLPCSFAARDLATCTVAS